MKTVQLGIRKAVLHWLWSALVVGAIFMPICGCKEKPETMDNTISPPTATLTGPEIGGQKVIVLRRSRTGDGTHPEFLSVTLLPGRGMNVFQITAYLPGRGEVPLLASPSLQEAAKLLNSGQVMDSSNKGFSMGGAFLFPFANRILGPLSADKKYISATWQGRTIQLLANWHGKRPEAPLHAIHGGMLDAKADTIDEVAMMDSAVATATYHLNTNGHWFSSNAVTIDVALDADAVDVTLKATNTGKEPEPVGIGWHPYFQLPSGNRANARLHLPAEVRVQVNNYDDVFPTGKLLPVHGTPYDFTAEEGAPLPKVLVDDSFVQLQRTVEGNTISEITDVAADYGLRVTVMTPLVRAIHVYSPADKSFVALEPQFNYGDPFGEEWKGEDTGMVTVEPGNSVVWKTRLEMFQPSQPPPSHQTIPF